MNFERSVPLKHAETVPEAPMVDIDEDGEEIPLGPEAEDRLYELAQEIYFRPLQASERRSLKKIIRSIKPRNLGQLAAAASAVGIGYGVHESLKDYSHHAATSTESVALVPEQQKTALQQAIEELAPELVVMKNGEHYTTRPQPRSVESGVVLDITPEQPEFEAYTSEVSPITDQYTATIAEEKTLGRMQVLFMTPEGRLLQGPTDLTKAAGYMPEEMTVSYQGGAPVGIPGTWSRPHREALSVHHGIPPSHIVMRHVYKSLEHADPEAVDTLLDLVTMRAQQIADREGASIAELIDTHFTFTPSSLKGKEAEREYIEKHLKAVLPGQIAQESLFNPEAVSTAGALGPLQIMPATWTQYATADMDIKSLSDSLIVAGQYYTASYEFMTKNLATEFSLIMTNYFNGDHQAFVEHFFIPFLVNGYNAGDGNMRKEGEWFIREYDNPQHLADTFNQGQRLQNKDIFFAFSELAARSEINSGYKTYAGAYEKEIAGWNTAIAESTKGSDVLASN